MNVCIASCRLLWNPTLGGHAWVNLNWAMGCEANAADVTLLETLPDDVSAQEGLSRLTALQAEIAALGMSTRVAVLLNDEQWDRFGDAAAEFPAIDPIFDETDLFLNFNYSVRPHTVSRFRRSALVDIDPGLLQMWLSNGAFSIPAHDTYFSIGETVGQPGAKFSDCGIRWLYTPPPVHLPAWPITPPADGTAYTTVTNWWGGYEVDDGKSFNNEKRTSFMHYLKLPRKTDAPLELAIFHEEGSWTEIPKLHRYGWRARPAYEVTGSPSEYRSYIQRSRGEFSCAKPSCMRFANAWISDRTICYLASGKPAIVQNTGPSRFLPDDDGLFRFSSMDEAAAMLRRVEEEYTEQCAKARQLAETHFDATRVVQSVLERAVA